MDHPFSVDETLDEALQALLHAWPVFMGERANPFSNSGERFDCAVFSVHAYSWGDDDQSWNFRWKDLEVRWYKYYGRGMSVSRGVTDVEARQLLQECMAALAAATP